VVLNFSLQDFRGQFAEVRNGHLLLLLGVK